MKKLQIACALCLLPLLCSGCRSPEEQQLAQEQLQQPAQEILLRQEEAEQTRKLRVTGCGDIKVAPELATVRFAFSGQAAEAEAAQVQLKERMDAVRIALIDMGVSRADISSDEITVYPIQDDKKDPLVVTGYNATSTITFITGDPVQVGNLIGAGLQAGASSVQDIVFELLEETTVYREALSEAVRDAADKADTIAQTAGLRLNGPLIIEEESVGDDLETETVLVSPGEELLQMLTEAGLLTVSARVTVDYEIVS